MACKLKALVAVTVAMGSFGSFSNASAQAAEEFHCGVSACSFTLNPDGSGTTAHHVFVVKNSIGESISFTCNNISGGGTAFTTMSSVTVSTIGYNTCKSVLGSATVDMNGCKYQFASSGGGIDWAWITLSCPAGSSVVITNQTCTVKIGPQGPLTGAGYSNTISGGQLAVTTTVKVPGIVASPSGECGFDMTKTPITSEYTTGNTIVTADNFSGAQVSGWWG